MELKDVKNLIDFDQRTMQAVVDVHAKKAHELDVIAKDKKRISEETWNDVYKQVAETKKQLDAKIAEDAALNKEEFKKASSLIKDTFDKNKAKWEEDLFNRCVE